MIGTSPGTFHRRFAEAPSNLDVATAGIAALRDWLEPFDHLAITGGD